jgi:hypothetical protein
MQTCTELLTKVYDALNALKSSVHEDYHKVIQLTPIDELEVRETLRYGPVCRYCGNPLSDGCVQCGKDWQS